MDDYTVKVVGVNNGGGSGVPPQAPSNPPEQPITPGTQPQARDYMPDTNRLTEEYRKLLQQQGGVIIPGSANAKQLWHQLEANSKRDVTESVQEKYAQRRLEINQGVENQRRSIDEETAKRKEAVFDKNERERERIDAEAEKMRQERMEAAAPSQRKDSLFLSVLNNEIESWKRKQYQKLDDQDQEELTAINKEREERLANLEKEKDRDIKEADKDEKDELASALRELTAVLKDSKESAERELERGDNPDSYLGRLREQRRQILAERDNAVTEKEAVAAGKRLADVDDKIKRASSPSDTDYLRSTQLVSGGLQQTLGGLQEASPGDMINGLGTSIVGMTGATGAGAMKALGWIGLAAAAVKGGWDALKGSAERVNAMGSLAAYRPGETENGPNGVLSATREAIHRDYAGYTIGDMGLGEDEFAKRAASIIRARGTSANWWEETYRHIGIEKTFGLDEGQLAEGARFDRYGENVTRGISDLVTILNGMKVQGATTDDFLRVREKYDFQQAVMQSYLSRTDKPSYEVANRAVAGMNAIRGITHDERDVSDYQVMQNAILNPRNERMRAMIYRSVSRIMPELVDTEGNRFSRSDGTRVDLIKRALQNPENEQKIISAVFGDFKSMYGGTNNQLGFHAWEEILQGINVERRDKIVDEITGRGAASQIFSGKADQKFRNALEEQSTNNRDYFTAEATKLFSNFSQTTQDWRNDISAVLDKILTALTGGD